jgi:hypothetical protein
MKPHPNIAGEICGNWQGIICPEPPSLRDNHAKIARQAAKMAADRAQKYPAMLARGTISPSQAASDIAIWNLIAADWRWIATGEGEPAPMETLTARREAINQSLVNIAAIVARDGDFTPALNFTAHLIIAMCWHLQPERGVRDVYFHADITHQMQRQSSANRQNKERISA